MKKTSKILAIILMLAMVLTVFMGTTVQAGGTGSSESTGGKDSSTTVDDLFNPSVTANTTGITNVGGTIVDIITTIGIIVAVVVLLILGIKYLMGSASEKAEYKKTMIPYLVGAILIFGASAIAKAVIAMSESIAGAAGG